MIKKLNILLVALFFGVSSLPTTASPCDKLEQLREENEWGEYTHEESVIKGDCVEEIMRNILNTDDRLLKWEDVAWKKKIISTLNEEEKSDVTITNITEPLEEVAPEKTEARIRLEEELRRELYENKEEELQRRLAISKKRTEERRNAQLKEMREISDNLRKQYEERARKQALEDCKAVEEVWGPDPDYPCG